MDRMETRASGMVQPPDFSLLWITKDEQGDEHLSIGEVRRGNHSSVWIGQTTVFALAAEGARKETSPVRRLPKSSDKVAHLF